MPTTQDTAAFTALQATPQPESIALASSAPPTSLDYLSFNPEWTDPNPPVEQIVGRRVNSPIINLEFAKRVVLIPEIWERLGLPGYPAASCPSPFRPDRKASFSIHNEGRRWKDHGTDESGDVIDFIAMAWGSTLKYAANGLLWLVNWKIENGLLAPSALALPSATPSSASLRITKPVPPPLRIGSEDEIVQVATMRGLTAAGLVRASNACVFRFGPCCGFPCWFVLDASGWCIEARRMDGRPFPEIPKRLPQRKAHTVRGSNKSWPVGIKTSDATVAANIIVTEGGPDLLAAYDLCHRLGRNDCRPVAFLGRSAGGRIHPEALAEFFSERVRIIPHIDADGDGLEAAKGWGSQIAGVGSVVDVVDLRQVVGSAHPSVKDLNDLVVLCRNQIANLSPLLP